MEATLHSKGLWDYYKEHGGAPWPRELLAAAQKDIDELVHILEADGVTVRRPAPYDFSKPYSTPDFEIASSCYALMPRDVLLLIGNQIIEAPAEGEPMRTILTEFEPVFDAADAIKCGRDIFIAQSSCCNRFGIDWLQRHLGDAYRVHEVEIHDTHPMYNCSRWICMNVLMLDEERVIVSKGEDDLIRALRDWGFKPIPCSFYDFETIGGGLHCASLDVRRRGQLESYF